MNRDVVRADCCHVQWSAVHGVLLYELVRSPTLRCARYQDIVKVWLPEGSSAE